MPTRNMRAFFRIPERYKFVALAATGFMNVYGLRVNLSAAVPAMAYDSETKPTLSLYSYACTHANAPACALYRSL